MKIFSLILWFVTFNYLRTEKVSNREYSPSYLVNSLNGKHLRVMWPNWEGNPKGLSGPLKGKLMIDYLAARFHFTYEFVRVTENWLEPINESIRGQFNYLWDDVVDVLVAQISPLSGRHKVIDLSSGFNYDTFALLIPVSNNMSSNTQAIIQPFQWPVWLGLLLSIIVVTYIFKKIQECLLIMAIDKSGQIRISDWIQMKLTNPYLYVFGSLLSQGVSYTSNRLPIRLIAGAWSLAALVFVLSYNSTLITYVLAPTNHRMVGSFHELVESSRFTTEKSDITLWLRKSGTIDNLLRKTENPDPLLLKLKMKVASSPESRCTLVSECANQVKPGTKNVFGEATTNLKNCIKERFQQTGKCEVEIVGSDLLSVPTSFGLQKHSPYTSSISKGLNELRENGLYNYWDISTRAYPLQCSANVKGLAEKQTDNNGPRRLSLKNLTGAFFVLLIGMAISFTAFLGEVFYCKFKLVFGD